LSTILKSLKKLEKEKEANRFPVQAARYIGPGAVASAGGSSRRKRGVRIRRGLVVLLIAGLGASSFYFYRQSHHHSPQVSRAAKTPHPPVQPAAGGSLAKATGNNPPHTIPRPMAKSQERPIQNIPEAVRRPAAEPATETNASNRQQVPALSAESTAQPPSAVAQPLPAAKPASAPIQRVARTQDRPQKRPQAATGPGRKGPAIAATPALQQSPSAKIQNSNRPVPQKQTRPSNAYDDLRPLTDGRLKIQAIVWSENQNDRMAVINTQIVHEGGSVDGFDLVAIRPEDVVVRGEGGGMYRVLFGRP
jgi:hypothetical protein